MNISTIEDPVEKNLAKVNQMQVNNQAGLTFEAGLRAQMCIRDRYKADGRRGAVSGLEAHAGIRGSCHIAGRRIWDLSAADREKGTERAFRFWAVFVYGNGCRAFVGTAAD